MLGSAKLLPLARGASADLRFPDDVERDAGLAGSGGGVCGLRRRMDVVSEVLRAKCGEQLCAGLSVSPVRQELIVARVCFSGVSIDQSEL